jgi:cbb3-type cytochrome oxidase cytochrome c subunit
MTLQREWRSINSVKLCNLCHSIAVRLQSVIEARRGEYSLVNLQ